MKKITHEELLNILKLQESGDLHWRSSLREIDLSDLNLRTGFNKKGLLVGVNFEWCDLRNLRLPYDADLSMARLCGARLDDAKFDYCWLEGTDLSNASITKAYFEGCKLNRANLSSAFLQETNLSNTSLQGSDLSGADLSNANLSQAKINRSDLTMAILIGANLKQADLRGTDLSDSDFTESELNDALFTGARYTENTKWAKGFNPKKAGAILMETS